MRLAFYSLVNFINMTSVHDVYWGAAKTILRNIEEIPNSNIVDIASMCYVSTATISRLCRKLNYESFGDFKRDVSMNLKYFDENVQRVIFDDQLPGQEAIDSGKAGFEKHFQTIVQNLQCTYDTLDYEDLEKIVEQIHKAKQICFAGNFLTQSLSMQLQIELAYLGKDCTGMYPIEQQKEVFKQLTKDDLIILPTIAGGYIRDSDAMREISKTKAYKIVITQLKDFPYKESVDMVLRVGNDHYSLIGKFSITYIFEVLEAMYHIKYGKKEL